MNLKRSYGLYLRKVKFIHLYIHFRFFNTNLTQFRSLIEMLVNFQLQNHAHIIVQILGVHFLPATSSSFYLKSLRGSN